MIAVTPPLEFCKTGNARDGVLLSASRADDLTTPVAAFLALARDRTNAFLLESVEGGAWRGRYSAIGFDPDFIWTVRDGQAFIAEGAAAECEEFQPDGEDLQASLRRALARTRLALPPGVPSIAAGLFGYIGYDMVRAVEALPGNAPDPLGLPQARLIRPRIVAVFDALKQDVTVYAPLRPSGDMATAWHAAEDRIRSVFDSLDHPPARPAATADFPDSEPVSNMSEDDFRTGVETLRGHIRAGDIFQGVLSQRFSLDFPHPPFALYRALRRLNPSPFLFHFQFPGFAVTGSSPEILVRLKNGVVTVRPIAGTRPRGTDPAEDDRLEADLLADPKERAEHLMLLDLGRNDVGRVAKPGSVRVTERETVERYSHVMHIVSNVEGDLADGEDAVSALFAGFPAGTVSGAPKVRAMELLDAAEPHTRGVYAGAVGYFSANGDMDTCIALRTAVTAQGRMHVQAGAGVVLDSDPESERQETLNKARALLRAAAEAGRFV